MYKISILPNIVKFALDDQHGKILKADGSVWSTAVNRLFVRVIAGGVVSADAGKSYNTVLMQDGSVWSTRKRSGGPEGDETIVGEFAFFFVSKIAGAASIVAGAYHSVVLMHSGRVRATG